jgi:hypothetical protein
MGYRDLSTNLDTDTSDIYPFSVRGGDILVCGSCLVNRVSGNQYFWCVENHSTGKGECGFVDSDKAAKAKIRESAYRLATKADSQFYRLLPAYKPYDGSIYPQRQVATRVLRQYNKEQRAKRAPKTGTQSSTVTEYVWWVHLKHGRVESVLGQYRITKKTPRCIYYDVRNMIKNEEERTVDPYSNVDTARIRKSSLERPVRVWGGGGQMWTAKEPLAGVPHGQTMSVRLQLKTAEQELATLRTNRHMAHPDRGGTAAAFVQANAAYELAKKRVQALKDALAR